MSARPALAVLALLGVAACTPAGEPARAPGLDVARVRAHVDALTGLGPRPSGSAAARAAVRYVREALAARGLAVEERAVGTVELPAIEVLGRTHRRARRATAAEPNLLVRLGPRGAPALLLMAHLDTVEGSPGALDDAASVGLLVELAGALAAAPPPGPVLVAFTAAEEDGLVGAEALARDLAGEVGIAVALDLVGGAGALSLNGAGAAIRLAELRWLAAAADAAGVIVRAPLPHRVVSRWWPQAERADHGAFTRRGVRALHLYHRGHDGELIDRAYHTAHDTAARVVPARVAEAARLLRALAARPVPAPGDADGAWLPVAANAVAPRAVVVGAEVALALLALGALLAARTARAPGGLGLGAGLGCAALALAAAAVGERALVGAPAVRALAAPGVAVLALALVLAGALGLVTRAAGRLAPWTGALRYHAAGVLLPLALGVGWLGAGAAELAWVWLAPAALVALAPLVAPSPARHPTRARVVDALALAAQLVPGALVLAPAQLRELAFHGLLPPGLPLTALVGACALAPLATAAWALRRRGPAGPLGTLALAVGSALAIVAGGALLTRAAPACSTATFLTHGLGCAPPGAGTPPP